MIQRAFENSRLTPRAFHYEKIILIGEHILPAHTHTQTRRLLPSGCYDCMNIPAETDMKADLKEFFIT